MDFSAPVEISIANIDPRGWRRISVASGKCNRNCSECTCVSDLQMLARSAAMKTISFGPSGSPLLNPEQIRILRSKREKIILDDSTDNIDLRVEIPPAPLEICKDEEL